MRGQYLHNHILVDPLERAFRFFGARTQREAATSPGRRTGYIDLLVDTGCQRVAVEAEGSAKRIARDLDKAAEVNADQLWIVAPNAAVVRAVRRKLARLRPACREVEILVLTLGQARQRVTHCFPLISGPNVAGKQIPVVGGEAASAASPVRGLDSDPGERR